jgi:hypothetical protein
MLYVRRPIPSTPNRPFELEKRRQLLVSSNDVFLSVVAVWVCLDKGSLTQRGLVS